LFLREAARTTVLFFVLFLREAARTTVLFLVSFRRNALKPWLSLVSVVEGVPSDEAVGFHLGLAELSQVL